MERSRWFFRIFFLVVACLVTTFYEFSESGSSQVSILSSVFLGIAKGILVFGICLLVEYGLRNCSLNTYNTAIVGVLVGTLMGFAITKCIETFFSLLPPSSSAHLGTYGILFIYLASVYFAIQVVYSCAESWWLSIPFVRLNQGEQAKKRELLLDISALEDSRIIDLARSGLVDHALVLPNFVLKDVQKGMENPEEQVRFRYRKCFEHMKRLESLPTLHMQQKEFHVSDNDDPAAKFVQAAKLNQAHIITSEPTQYKADEELTIINLDSLANTIKPGAQRGEILTIKILRLGKEPKQGVGYLDDGTMVVVNGGGEFLGSTIRTQVLSQKHSTSGKIVFCNAITFDDKTNGSSATVATNENLMHQYTY